MILVDSEGEVIRITPARGAVDAAMSMDFYDYFSGCGGTSQGMRQAGLKIRLGIDWDIEAARTYKANFKSADFLCRDIRELRPKDVAPYVKVETGRPIVFGACAPCQPFSKQNRDRKRNDGRKALLGEFHRFVKAYRPEYLFVENVPGLNANHYQGPFREFLDFLDRLKYWYAYKIVMAYHWACDFSGLVCGSKIY